MNPFIIYQEMITGFNDVMKLRRWIVFLAIRIFFGAHLSSPPFHSLMGVFYFVINQATNQEIPLNTNIAGNKPPSNSMLVFSLPLRLVNVCSKLPSISFFQFMQPLLSFLRRYSQCAKLNLPR